MALHFKLQINHDVISTYHARRLPGGGTNPDDVNQYEVTIEPGVTFLVSHRYGDGAWELVRKSLEKLAFIRPPNSDAETV